MWLGRHGYERAVPEHCVSREVDTPVDTLCAIVDVDRVSRVPARVCDDIEVERPGHVPRRRALEIQPEGAQCLVDLVDPATDADALRRPFDRAGVLHPVRHTAGFPNALLEESARDERFQSVGLGWFQ